MGMGSHYRDVKEPPGKDVGGADASADHSRPCAVQSGVRALGPP